MQWGCPYTTVKCLNTEQQIKICWHFGTVLVSFEASFQALPCALSVSSLTVDYFGLVNTVQLWERTLILQFNEKAQGTDTPVLKKSWFNKQKQLAYVLKLVHFTKWPKGLQWMLFEGQWRYCQDKGGEKGKLNSHRHILAPFPFSRPILALNILRLASAGDLINCPFHLVDVHCVSGSVVCVHSDLWVCACVCAPAWVHCRSCVWLSHWELLSQPQRACNSRPFSRNKCTSIHKGIMWQFQKDLQ